MAGATGVLGGKLARGLHQQGARLVIAGRDRGRLAERSAELGECSSAQFSIGDGFDPEAVVARAAGELGGLDWCWWPSALPRSGRPQTPTRR